MLVSVLIPSRTRTERLVNSVEGVFKTTQGHDVEVVAVVEENPLSAPALLASEYLKDKRIKIVERAEHKGPIAGWNEALENASPYAGAFVMGADDLEWKEGWLDAALSALDTFPDREGLVGFNDMDVYGKEFATHFLATRKFLIEDNGGVICIPHYTNYWTDVETGNRARRAQRYVWAKDAIVDHRSAYNGKVPFDPDYAVRFDTVNNVEEKDHQTYDERSDKDFPDDFKPILKPPPIYWAMLPERHIMEPVFNVYRDIVIVCDRLGYEPLNVEYGRTDLARNALCDIFLRATKDPEAWLVMLDDDHKHPVDIVERIVTSGKRGVVFALSRRRGKPPNDILAYRRDAEGEPRPDTPDARQEWMFRHPNILNLIDEDVQGGGMIAVDAAATGAVGIQRWVFDELYKVDCLIPYFRYVYKLGSMNHPTEDVYFCATCEYAGVPMWLNADLVIPHSTYGWV